MPPSKSTMTLSNPLLPPGSTILVTGANGLLGSHIVDACLAAGFKVRATVRDPQRCAWLAPFFNNRHDSDDCSIVKVTDPRAENAFAEAVRGCSGIIHCGTHFDLSERDFSTCTTDISNSIVRLLEAAGDEKSVKSVVLCSSAWTAASPAPGVKYSVEARSWNEPELEKAKTNPGPFSIYIAGKIVGEKTAWKWIEDHQTKFHFSAVLPDTVLGHILCPEHQGIPSTAGAIKTLYENGDMSFCNMVEPQWFIDVGDVGRLHVAALVIADANGKRFLGHAEPFNWNDVLAILRKTYPDRDFMTDMDLDRDVGRVDASESLKLLKDVFGQDGWTSLEDSVKANAAGFAPVK